MGDRTSGREHLKRLKDRFRGSALKDFNDREIFELLLGHAYPGTDARHLAGTLLKRFGTLREVLDAGADEIRSMEGDGAGEDAAVLIGLIKGVTVSYRRERAPRSTIISTKQDALNHINRRFAGKKAERFLAIYLNSRNEVLGTSLLHEGLVNRETVQPRAAIEEALRLNGHGVIFVHRHPRASCAPTAVERQFIKALWRAASAIDLVVHDHLILSRLGLYSALEAGLISAHPEHLSKAASPDTESLF